MKYIKALVLMAMIAPAFIAITGCGDDPEPPVQKPDTTNNNTDPIILTSFKMGLYSYELVVNQSKTTANYNNASDLTKIVITGDDASRGKTEVKIDFPGKTIGTFKQADGAKVLLEITTNKSDPIKEVTYQTDPETNLIIGITEYGAVGDTIRGTFSGKLKVGINSYQVQNGKFAVVRKGDI